MLRRMQVRLAAGCCLPRGHRVSPHCAASNALVAELVRPSPPSLRRPTQHRPRGQSKLFSRPGTSVFEKKGNVFFLVNIVMIMSNVNATKFSTTVYRDSTEPNSKTKNHEGRKES